MVKLETHSLTTVLSCTQSCVRTKEESNRMNDLQTSTHLGDDWSNTKPRCASRLWEICYKLTLTGKMVNFYILASVIGVVQQCFSFPWQNYKMIQWERDCDSKLIHESASANITSQHNDVEVGSIKPWLNRLQGRTKEDERGKKDDVLWEWNKIQKQKGPRPIKD